MRREETEERSRFGDPVPLGSDEKGPRPQSTSAAQ